LTYVNKLAVVIEKVKRDKEKSFLLLVLLITQAAQPQAGLLFHAAPLPEAG
jgi:hypothetical protein